MADAQDTVRDGAETSTGPELASIICLLTEQAVSRIGDTKADVYLIFRKEGHPVSCIMTIKGSRHMMCWLHHQRRWGEVDLHFEYYMEERAGGVVHE